MNRRMLGLALAAAALVPLGGCYPKEISDHNPLGLFMRLLTGNVPIGLTVAGASTTTKIDTMKEIYFSVSAGGLSGTYDITFTDGDAITYGTFSGTTQVKRGRFITIKDDSSEGLFGMVAALVAEQVGGNVTLEVVKAKISAYQTPGGVEVVYKGKITFKGVVADGPNMGRKIRGGKLTMAGSYTGPV